MQNRKLKPFDDAPRHAAPEATEVTVAVADASTATSVPSPALSLQASLQQQLEGASPAPKSSAAIPFGWTALGLIAFCGAFWSAVVYVLN